LHRHSEHFILLWQTVNFWSSEESTETDSMNTDEAMEALSHWKYIGILMPVLTKVFSFLKQFNMHFVTHFY
jgi:hypothetical protein